MLRLREDEMIPFDMYFASICSMQVHPGAGSKENQPLTLEQSRDMAMEMIIMRRAVEFVGGDVCRGV